MKRRRSLFIHLSHIRLLAQKFALVILFLSAFILMLVNKTDTILIEKTSSLATDVVTPMIDVLVIPAKVLAQVYDYFHDLKEVQQDNLKLREENRQLNLLYERARALEIENKLLSGLLNFVVPPEAEYITARVVAEEGDAFSHSLIAYIGNKDVKRGQIAISDKGVVGRVDKVSNVYAKILLITDINSRIPVMIEKTRVRGIVAGDNTMLPKLVFTPLGAELNVGDRVVTSGVSGVFPAGLPVGKVVSVSKYEIKVKPFTNLEELEYVKLVDYDLGGIVPVEEQEEKDER